MVSFYPLWPWNLTNDLENNRAPLSCCIKLCASFRSHLWIQTGVTVQKNPSWGTICFDHWPWPFTWTSLISMAITPENFMMIQWEEHCLKRVWQTDGRTDRSVLELLGRSWETIVTILLTGDANVGHSTHYWFREWLVTSLEINISFLLTTFSSRKCRLQNVGHFVQESKSYVLTCTSQKFLRMLGWLTVTGSGEMESSSS